MTKFVRPISRVTAIDLTDCEVDKVSGAWPSPNQTLQTDVYTNIPDSPSWRYDGSHAD